MLIDKLHIVHETGDIVGISASGNGRSCEQHACCGNYLQLNDTVIFKAVMIERDGEIENAIAAKVLREGTVSCIVGFLPLAVVVRSGEFFVNKVAQITEIYTEDSSLAKRRKMHQNLGVCKFRLLDALFDNGA
jgi:hypothetical protein